MSYLKLKLFALLFICFVSNALPQQPYLIDPKYPVHDLQNEIGIIADKDEALSAKQILTDTSLNFIQRSELPKYLEMNVVHWAKIDVLATDSLKGWMLNFEDKLIGAPAWGKSNGKVDVYAFANNELIFHKKTGVEYPKSERDVAEGWSRNRVSMDDLPVNEPVSLVIRVQNNDLGYPPYFNLSARGPTQPYYHQIYQWHNSFNIFMFGVTFIIFLYHLLQFIYLRQKVFMWFSVWLFFCLMTMSMTVGLIIGDISKFRYPIWIVLANSIFYSFWFFGRSFMNSKEKFPKLDKFIVGLALFILLEIFLTAIYVIAFDPEIMATSVGWHYPLLNLYTVLSLVLSIILAFKKDQFARYFGIGSILGSLALVLGTLWSMRIISLSFDPFAMGMFLQIIIYSFGIAYRQQQLSLKSQQEKLESQKNLAEMERMKDLDELKTRFFANISHEFRTPLSLISGPLKLAKKRSDENEGIVINEKTFNTITYNSNRLQNLIDQLLELSKIESGAIHLNLTQGGIIGFIKSLVFSFESMSERSNISLNTSFPAELNSAFYDKDKIEKIMVNLMSNAFKYTPDGGTVTITVDYNETHIVMEIQDTGKGMDKEEIKRIFERFYRVEGTEEKGSGIGLALTKEMVDVLNGQISVSSKKSEGTTFKVRIPYVLNLLPKTISVVSNDHKTIEYSDTTYDDIVSANTEDLEELHENSSSDSPIVLVVEDNADLRDFIKEIISPNYKVLLAEDGMKGERMALEHIPDLIVTDVMMPKKDGYQLCNSLKLNPKTSHVPIIMLTAKAGQENKMEGLTQGVDAYLTKPINTDELLLRIKNLIENRKKIWEHFKSLDVTLIDDLKVHSVDDQFLQKVVTFIKNNLDNEQLSVEDLSREVGFSRSQLHRKLKALTNKSANQTIVEMRLNEARQMLINKSASVSEAAYAVGYSNLSYFTKSFKEKFGVLPSKI